LLEIQEILKTLNDNGVRYLLAGGFAGILYGVPRTTVDVDVIVDPEPENITATIQALESLGLVPDSSDVEDILGMGGVTFSNDREVDVITNPIAGSFEKLWRRREEAVYKDVSIPSISREDHIATLRKLKRKQDIEDLEFLEEK
jgi:hypothetical protein